jgi:hypothetical protein
MNIQDIMRGLPFPVQGLLMQAYGATANRQPTPQNAGAGRGFVNPPMVNPNADPPQMPRVQPSRPVQVPKDEAGFEDMIARIMAGGSTDELQNAPAVEATPVQQAMQPDLPAPDAQETAGAAAPASGAESPGILGYLDKAVGFSQPDFIGRLGTALAVAGSQDPTKALMQVQQNRGEEAKIAEARRRSNQPKIEPITGTPFFQITYPDGRMETVNNPALAKFYQEQSASKAANKRSDMELQAELNAKANLGKADIKASEEARPLLNDIQSLKGRWQQAQGIIAGQGTMAQIQGIPGIAGIAGFFGGDEVAKNKFLEGLTVDETLLNTARTKGAISNQEMNLFKSPIPSVTDDREKVWKPWIEKRLEVLDKMEKFQAGEVARSPAANTAPAAPAAAASPPPSDQLRSAVTAAGIPFEPEKFQYRIGPNGQVQRKAK